MNKKNITHIYIAVLAMLMFVPSMFAQNNDEPIKVIQKLAEVQDSRLNTSFDVILGDNFKLGSNEMIVITPILKSNTTDDFLDLEPMVVLGKTRDKVVKRNLKYKNTTVMPDNALTTLKRKKRSQQQLEYSNSVAYSPWMRNAELLIQSSVWGCADCESDTGIIPVTARLLPNIEYTPSYKLTFIVPEVEAVKARSDKHSATFNFVVNRYELLRDFKDNRSKFDEVDRIIREVQSDDNISITEFNIVGYASPEGNFPHNQFLAENRAKSFADYIVSKFGINRNMFKVSSIGEDWEGLRRAVEASSMSDKSEILRIIDTVENPDARDNPLRALSSGNTYRTLLNDYYPALRRTDYSIAYVARAFDVEEAKDIIKTNPKLLSLNEMFLVSETYEVGSEDFKEVFDIAVRMFPDSEIAVANAAAAEIEAGHLDNAIRLIERSQYKANMLNNLGVAYARAGKLDDALKIFAQAAASGDKDATHNKEELEKHLKGLED